MFIKSDSISFINQDGNKQHVCNCDLSYIRIKKGNNSIIYGLWGLALTTTTVIFFAVDNSSSSSNNNHTPFYFSFAISGGIIGSLIGLASPKWKRYNIKNQ